MQVFRDLSAVLLGIFGTDDVLTHNGIQYRAVVDEGTGERFEGNGDAEDVFIHLSVDAPAGATMRLMDEVTYGGERYRIVRLRRDEAMTYVSALRISRINVAERGGIAR
jgi:hypothetical protein